MKGLRKHAKDSTPTSWAKRNPLDCAVGAVLARLREIDGRLGKETGPALGMKPSTYRMLEVGSAGLQPAVAFRLSERYQTLDPRALAALVVILGLVWSPIPAGMADLRRRLDRATKKFPAFSRVARAMLDAPELISAEPEAFARHPLTEELHRFLRADPFNVTSKLKDEYAQRFTRTSMNISPLLLDSVFGMLGALRGVNFRFTGDEVYSFEKQHLNDFVAIYAVVSDENLFIASVAHEGEVGYGYLAADKFERLVVFITARCDAARVRGRFIAEMRKVLVLRDGKSFDQVEFEKSCRKIAVTCTEDLPASAGADFTKILTDDGVLFQNFWLYALSDTKVAFLDAYKLRAGSEAIQGAKAEAAPVTGEVLSLGKVSDRFDILSRYIDSEG